MHDPQVWALIVLEEAAELAQSCGVPPETAELCLREVYARPPGDTSQEIGGVLMTIYLFVAALGWTYSNVDGNDPLHYFAAELRRVLVKPPKHFADRNAAKIATGLDVPPTTGG